MVRSQEVFNWEKSYTKANAYYKKFGILYISSTYKEEDGYSLGDWIRQQIEKYRAKKILKEQVTKLEGISTDWFFPLEREWEKHFTSAKRYFEIHEYLQVSTYYKDEDGFVLGLW